MAAEIAKSAVDNGRWHHAAASRALEQQLSPDNGFLALRPSSKGRNGSSRRASDGMNIFKSASSVNFSSLAGTSITASLTDTDFNQSGLSANEYDLDDDLRNKLFLTTMAHSSGSESSSDGTSDAKEAEEEECEKWAADFIAGALDYATTPISIPNASRRQRSISFVNSESSDESSNSDDSSQLSKSPVGFWFVPPSASKTRSALDDQNDTIWSPEISPNSSNRNINDEPFSLDRDRIVKFENAATHIHPPSLNSKLSSLTVGEERDESTENDHTKENVDNNENKFIKHDFPDSQLPLPSLLKRSLSYSAFSFQRISDSLTSNTNSSRVGQSAASIDEYEKYYKKFIRLLIDRETTHTKKPC